MLRHPTIHSFRRCPKLHRHRKPPASRPQADALEIESLAKRRLADEYDDAQDRGEVAAAGGDKSKLPNENFATVADLGLTHKDIHEARQIRDAILGPLLDR